MVKEKDAFESEDFREMTARLEYLKEIRGIGVLHLVQGWGKHLPEMFCERTESQPIPMCISMPVNSKCAGILQAVMRGFGIRIRFGKSQMFRSIQERLYYLYKEKKAAIYLHSG